VIMAILAAWFASSFVCQFLMNRPALSEQMRYVWIWIDVAFFSLVLYVDEAMDGPLVIGYPLLIAASGLWFRDKLVWFTAAMAMLSYAALVAINWENAKEVHKHFMFLVSLAMTGFVITYQVRRVRALSKYYERRSLP